MSTYQNLTYDAIGRLTNDDSIARSYHYDYRNMISLLTQAHNLPDGITRKDTMICTYNYKNQRVMKLQKHRWWNQMCGGGGGEMSQPQGGGTGKGTDAGGGTSLTMGPPSQLPEGCLVESMQATFYVWSGNEVIAEYNESNELKYQYVYANGMRIAQLKKNSGTSKDTTYLHPDYQGSTRLQTKPDKTTYAKIDYDVWGQVRQQSGYPSAYTYTGQEWDDENSANLFYLHARYYDPKLGRFTTPDPLPSDLNPYSYCNNNPVMLTDVSGMSGTARFDPTAKTPDPYGPGYHEGSSETGADGLMFGSPHADLSGYNPRYVGPISGHGVQSRGEIVKDYLDRNGLRLLSGEEYATLCNQIAIANGLKQISDAVYKGICNLLNNGMVFATDRDRNPNPDYESIFLGSAFPGVAINSDFMSDGQYATALLTKETIHALYADKDPLYDVIKQQTLEGCVVLANHNSAFDVSGHVAWMAFYDQVSAIRSQYIARGATVPENIDHWGDFWNFWEPYDNRCDLYDAAGDSWLAIDNAGRSW
jgi:RHS repeat-associated protein